MSVKHALSTKISIPFLCLGLLFAAGCAQSPSGLRTLSSADINPELHAMAIREVRALQSQGRRVWCVPFARNASGVNIRGNANTWWSQAKGQYTRGKEPTAGAVMAFKGTNRNPMGHVAVVSKVVSPREVLVDHANWERNKISLQMSVIDVSPRNDWSNVRLESQPGTYGRGYPINGFIYPDNKLHPNTHAASNPTFAFMDTAAKP
ncbi:CHAP domain-containing protein [Sulfitobacter sp. CW3]|uniref:CHAP domain-containing protein n=1 Tax=Sulfitobacter sp. CW3 TaxID=2861965 RepID=UPI001C5F00D0|nr:CHAP domain-containing protein [Sulfitobacter sp. CW3]MBW4961451.1 CHAP domain-containing protein [Sulfitobacter sp. CW3]